MLPPRRCPTCHRLAPGGRCFFCIQAYEARRDNANSRGYCSARWRQLRAQKLATDPLCSVCLAAGKTVAASDVDHLRRHHGPNDPLFYEWTNLSSKCHSCHSRKTATEDSIFANRGRDEATR